MRVVQLQTHVKELEEKLSTIQEQCVRLVETEKQHCLKYLPAKGIVYFNSNHYKSFQQQILKWQTWSCFLNKIIIFYNFINKGFFLLPTTAGYFHRSRAVGQGNWNLEGATNYSSCVVKSGRWTATKSSWQR